MANSNYSIKQLIEMSACTNCRYCADVCPAVSAAKDGQLSALYRMKGLQEILKSRRPFLKKIFAQKELSPEEWKTYSQTVFQCTLCGNCTEVCPVGIHLKELWISLRQDLVESRHYPKKINMIRKNLQASYNVFDEDNEERTEWVEDMTDPPDHGYLKDEAEFVYFAGCVASYFPLAQKIPIAFAEILDAAQVDFTLLGEAEWCCGFPLLGAGLKGLAQDFIDHNIAAVKAKRAAGIIFACPSCFQMWREFYPYQASNLEIYHASQFLMQLIQEDRMPFSEVPLKVTYHDPCDLGRGARIFEEPRDVIRSIPGIRLTELPRNRENCRCCGGGGNLEMINAKLAAEIAGQKIDEALHTGAETIITACQQCVRTMTTYAKRNKVPIRVMDITQLVHSALNR